MLIRSWISNRKIIASYCASWSISSWRRHTTFVLIANRHYSLILSKYGVVRRSDDGIIWNLLEGNGFEPGS